MNFITTNHSVRSSVSPSRNHQCASEIRNGKLIKSSIYTDVGLDDLFSAVAYFRGLKIKEIVKAKNNILPVTLANMREMMMNSCLALKQERHNK